MPESDGQQPEILKSVDSRTRSYILFRNCTERMVDLIWVGYQGEYVQYAKLQPTETKMMNTFATHPWIFRDPDTGERMLARGNDVYMPEPFKQGQLVRYLVQIRSPLRSLKSNALWRIAKLLLRDDAVHELELPRSLIADVLEIREIMAAARDFQNTPPTDDDDDDDEEDE